MRTAIQLYSLREVETPLPALVERVGDLGYDGVEFAYRVADADREAVRAAMEEAGVEAAGAHVPVDEFDEFDATVERYRGLGCRTLVVPYLDESHFASRDAVERTAAELAGLAERLADHDLAFGYHNHTHEFVSVDGGETAYEALAAATPTSVDLQLDVGLAALAGQDPVALLDRFGDRVRQLHLKDFDLDAERSVDLGDGDVAIEACVEWAREADVDWLVVEYEDATDPLASAERSLAALDRLL